MKRLSLRINKPSAAELAMIGSCSNGAESQSRYGGFGTGSRLTEQSFREKPRYDFSRSRSAYFSSSQQSQQSTFSQSQQTSDLPPLPGPGCNRSAEDFSQRIASLENLLSGISDDVKSMMREQQRVVSLIESSATENVSILRKELEIQNAKFSAMLREQGGCIKRMFDDYQAAAAAVAAAAPAPAPAPAPKRAPPKLEVVAVDSSDDETVSRTESGDSSTKYVDLYALCGDNEVAYMREKMKKARRDVKRRR